jgi:hypothetical protein
VGHQEGVGDSAAESTWPRRVVDIESYWGQCCQVMLVITLCRCRVILIMMLLSHASDDVVLMPSHVDNGATESC